MNMFEQKESKDNLPSRISYLRRTAQFEAEMVEVLLDEELQIVDTKIIGIVDLTPDED